MALKDELKNKVSDDIQLTPEFKTLLSIVSRKKIRSADVLKRFVNARIAICQETIKAEGKSNLSGSKQRLLAKCRRELDYFRLIKEKVLRYV
jgi:hypothetical protein